MTVKQAVVERFLEICHQRRIKPNELANLAGITPSTVYSMLDETRKDVSIVTIKSYVMGWILRWENSSLLLNLMDWNRR